MKNKILSFILTGFLLYVPFVFANNDRNIDIDSINSTENLKYSTTKCWLPFFDAVQLVGKATAQIKMDYKCVVSISIGGIVSKDIEPTLITGIIVDNNYKSKIATLDIDTRSITLPGPHNIALTHYDFGKNKIEFAPVFHIRFIRGQIKEIVYDFFFPNQRLTDSNNAVITKELRRQLETNNFYKASKDTYIKNNIVVNYKINKSNNLSIVIKQNKIENSNKSFECQDNKQIKCSVLEYFFNSKK